MGLDSIELLMKIEKHFGVTFSDENSAKIGTVGDMHSWLCSELSGSISTNDLSEDEIWTKLQHLISEHLALPLEAVRPEAHFVHDLRVD